MKPTHHYIMKPTHHPRAVSLSSASLCTLILTGLCSVAFNMSIQAQNDRYFWKGGSNDFMTWWSGEDNAPSNEAPGLNFHSSGGSRNAIVQGSGDVVNLNNDYTANYSFDNLVIRSGATMNINGNLDIATAPTNLNLASGGTYNHNAYTVQANALTGGDGTYNLNSGGALVLTNGLAASDAAYNFNFGTGGNGENVSLTANNVQIDNANDVVFTVGSGSNLTLTGSGSNFADGFAVNGGTLQLGNGGAGGSIDTSYALDLASGGKLIVNRTDTVTQGTDFSTAAITGAGTIAHHGTGTLILDRANSLGNGTTHIGDLAGSDSATRVLEIRDNSSLGSGQITFYKGGTLDLGADALTVSNFIFNGNYSSGTKTIKLDSDEAGHTGTIAGAMIIQNGTAGSFEVEVGAADTLTMSGTIGNYANGGAGITKTGDGTLILSGTNTYKGATTVNAGVLKLSGGSAIDDIRDVVVGIDGTLDLNDSNETINRLTGSGTVDNTAAGTATLIVGSNGNDATFDGTITDTGAALKFRKTGSGTQTLTAASTYHGGTDIYKGTIVANDSAALGTGQVYMGVTAGATQTLAIGAGGLNISNNFFLQNSNSTHVIKLDVAGSNSSTLSGNMTNQVDYVGEWDFVVGDDDTLTVSGILRVEVPEVQELTRMVLVHWCSPGLTPTKGQRESMKELSHLPPATPTAALELTWLRAAP